MATPSVLARSPLVGRRDELARLEAWQEHGLARRPATVAVVGDAGIGKTTLVGSFVNAVGDRGEVVVGACRELGGDLLPWAPLVDVVEGLVDRHGVGTVLELAGPSRVELARLVPLLASAGEVPDRPGAGHARLADALTSLLRAAAARRPLVLVLEDLHWADSSTAALLPAIVHALADAPAVVVVTLRSDEQPPGSRIRRMVAELVRGGRGELVELAPLTRQQQARQLSGLLGVPPTRRLLDDVWSRAAGNPFFAEELVAHTGNDLPITIHELLVSRLVALPRPTRNLVTTASLLGSTVDVPVVRRVLDLDDEGLDAAVAPAVQAHVLVTGADGRPRFRHALLAEVAARMLLPTEATRLHGRIADTLSAGVGEAHGPERTAAVARHRLSAGDHRRALPASLDAARAMTGMLAFSDAVRFHERALATWDRVPDPEAVTGMGHGRLLAEGAEVAHLAGEPDRAAAWCRAALDEVDPEVDAVHAGLLHERLGRYLWMAADGVGAEAAYIRAVELVPASPPTAARARVLSGRSQILMLGGRFAEARTLADQALVVARTVGARGIEGHARNNRGVARAYLGELDRGLADLDAARDIADELLDDVDDVLRAIVNRCSVLFDSGRLSEAADVALEAVTVSERLGLERRKGVWSRCDAAECLLAVGRVDEAADLVEDAEGFEPEGVDQVRTRLVRARLALVRGRLDEADVALAACADIAAAVTDEQLVSPIARALVRVRLAQDRITDALDVAESAWPRLPAREPAFAVPLAAAAVEAAVEGVRSGAVDRAVAERWLVRAEQLAAGTGLGLVQARLATARAEATRLDPGGSPSAWERAVVGWEALGAPLEAAHDRWRLAEAVLVSGGPREQAGDLARRAEEAARIRGATWLADRVRDFAGRARLEAGGSRDGVDGLTPREHEVLALVVDGLTNRQIGERLFVGHRTVATHVSNVLAKLSASSRSEAAAIAVRAGLFD